MSKETPEPAPLPIALSYDVARLSREREHAVAIDLDAEARGALARFLGLDRLGAMAFQGKLAPEGRERWRLTGQLGAEIGQTCVVTLEPVASRIELTVDRAYAPAAQGASAAVEIGPNDDEPDTYGTEIDVAATLVELLALAIDPYPRAPGAALGPATFAAPGIAPLSDEDVKPFAGLAQLREKLGDGRD